MINIKLKGLSQEETGQMLPSGLILLGYRGSIAHGMYVPNNDPNSFDDKDIMGVFVAHEDHYVALNKTKETKEKFIREWDSVCYEVRKFFKLLLNNNPNVLSLLWLPEKYYIFKKEAGQALIDNRDIFISKKAYHSFSGYAHGQFKRMTNHAYEGYMGKKRKKLVEKYGFDTKNAAHLIRLLKMGIEFLTDGTLYVEREDAQQLLSIKHGEWSLEKIKKESERLFSLCEEAYVRSNLPNEPDYDKANDLCRSIIKKNLS